MLTVGSSCSQWGLTPEQLQPFPRKGLPNTEPEESGLPWEVRGPRLFLETNVPMGSSYIREDTAHVGFAGIKSLCC